MLNGYLSEAKRDFLHADNEDARKYFYNDFIKEMRKQIEVIKQPSQIVPVASRAEKLDFYEEELKSFIDKYGSQYSN